MPLQTPAMIRFGQNTEDEVFISHEAATRGVEIENTGSEPLVGLRYFGPGVHANLPLNGAWKAGRKQLTNSESQISTFKLQTGVNMHEQLLSNSQCNVAWLGWQRRWPWPRAADLA